MNGSITEGEPNLSQRWQKAKEADVGISKDSPILRAVIWQTFDHDTKKETACYFKVFPAIAVLTTVDMDADLCLFFCMRVVTTAWPQNKYMVPSPPVAKCQPNRCEITAWSQDCVSPHGISFTQCERFTSRGILPFVSYLLSIWSLNITKKWKQLNHSAFKKRYARSSHLFTSALGLGNARNKQAYTDRQSSPHLITSIWAAALDSADSPNSLK